MPFGLTIGTDRATALQQSIQDELTRRNYSPDPDPVMAEYITIMIINDKTPEQITGELEDLIGSDFDPSFTDWLFAEAEKGAEESVAPAQTGPQQPAESVASVPPPANDSSARRPPRNGVYQQALSQALPSSGQKRTASARSPSPNHAHKMRRTDLPTGPRAMQREGNPRSLIDRVGGRRNSFGQDEIQSHIDTIVGNPTPEQQQAMMMSAGFPMGMDMSVMNGMANPLMLQEMMMNQMALMAQMASTMGIINPATGQFGGGFNDPAAFQGQPGMEGGFHGGPQNGRGRGGAGRGRGRGRGGPPSSGPKPMAAENAAIPIVAPTPAPPPAVAPAPTGGLTGYILPERPQSPTLCKFGVKCSNAHCRWSHPSPVATAETGVVLSNEACENGKDCKDKDCVKAHVSPAVLNPQAASQPPPAAHHAPPPHVTHPPPSGVPCRFGAACTRTGCTFTHPPNHPSNASNPHFAQPCHFGAACTRANCLFKHPEGRVLPNSFHRGLSAAAPLVSVPNPETGSIGAASHHKSVKFNGSGGASVKEKLEKQMKEIEEQKQAVKAAQEAAKKDKERSVPAAA
ncbi:hypothetical protein MIND_00030000 [Mycena indigotica]|uniref:Nab2 type CCCH zinc finger 4 domain-containing protein n=1 Tax=Mycena indigotica TaxID=2126181 RepID=A0A8H6TCY9_9AGAR|nr:uncharacterized protein MIND_00030000 [Mycena indigotica]KAF7315156.1 hypothetical protein MIND_00030000 [Mycena indigotica]